MMSMKTSSETRELEVLQNVRRKFAQGLEDCEEIILPIAQSLAPERTGAYKRSIGYYLNKGAVEAALYSGIYKPGDPNYSPHAHLIEWGSHKMAPRAPMRKAAEQARDRMGQAIARRCKEPV